MIITYLRLHFKKSNLTFTYLKTCFQCDDYIFKIAFKKPHITFTYLRNMFGM